METIEIELRIDRTMDVSVHIEDVIEGINELPMKRRWNHVARIINEVETDLSEMTEEQKEITKNYLTKKLELFNSTKDQ